jgi:MoxR-like ATPase
LAGRQHVLPEDVQALFEPLAGHRLQPLEGREEQPIGPRDILTAVVVP